MRTCQQCNKIFQPSKTWSRFCSNDCRKRFHYENSTRIKNIKTKKPIQEFTYENVGGQIIQKPIEEHVYDPLNVPGIVNLKNGISYRHGRLDDRTNYYRGNGIFGYDDHVAIGL